MSAPPRFVQPRPAGPAASRAGLALWLGIGSVAASVLSLGLLALVTLPAGIAALVLGIRARRQGGGSAAAILGGLGIALSLLAMLFWIVLVVLGGLTLEFLSFWDSIEKWLELPPIEDPANPDAPII